MGFRISSKPVLIVFQTNLSHLNRWLSFFQIHTMITLPAIFKQPSALQIAQRSYDQVQRDLLAQEATAEYHAKMVEYHKQTLRRLTNYLNEHNPKV